MFSCQQCSMLSTVLFSVVTPHRRLIQAQLCRTVLLTTLNNVGSKTLFNAVFNNPEQVVRFLLCTLLSGKAILTIWSCYANVFVFINREHMQPIFNE